MKEETFFLCSVVISLIIMIATLTTGVQYHNNELAQIEANKLYFYDAMNITASSTIISPIGGCHGNSVGNCFDGSVTYEYNKTDTCTISYGYIRTGIKNQADIYMRENYSVNTTKYLYVQFVTVIDYEGNPNEKIICVRDLPDTKSDHQIYINCIITGIVFGVIFMIITIIGCICMCYKKNINHT